MQTVSLILATKNSAGRLPFLLKDIRKLVDEVVIGVDDSSTDETWDVARSLADQCVSVKSEGYVESFLYRLFPYCSGDWILRIDDDEFLSLPWEKRVITELDPTLYKAYGIPRYQLTCLEPKPYHLPKGLTFQLRLFWNHQKFEPVTIIHSCGVRFQGSVRRLPFHLSMLHIYLMMASREDRERKVAQYESISAGAGHQWFYLFDDTPDQPIQLLPPFLVPDNLREYWAHLNIKDE